MFDLNARRADLDLGADTPLFAPFYIFVKTLLLLPLEPTFPGVRTAFDLIAVRRLPELGSEALMNRVMNTFE